MSPIVVPLMLLWPAAIVVSRPDGRRRAVGWFAVAVLGAVLVSLAVLTVEVVREQSVDIVAGGWPATVGIRLRADVLGVAFAVVSVGVLAAALAQAVVTGTLARMTPALTLFMALGLTGLFLTGDVFSFYVFFELSMISAYALAAAEGGARRLGAAFIFAVVNLLGSFLFLIAVGALYRATGTLEMTEVAAKASVIEPTTAILIAVTFFVAFGIKLGLFPFHFWLPSLYRSASPAVAAMLAGGLANIGAYGLIRFGGAILPRELELSAAAITFVGLISTAYGAMQAIARHDVREVLAYSAIGHAGYVLVALGLGGPVGLAAAVVFSLANALNKALLFLAAGVGGRLVATAFLIGALSVAGVPPTAGFFGKAALFDAGVQSGQVATVVLLFVGGALSFVYLFQAYQQMHWSPTEAPRPSPAGHRAVAVGLAALVLALGVWPEPMLAAGEHVGRELTAGVSP